MQSFIFLVFTSFISTMHGFKIDGKIYTAAKNNFWFNTTVRLNRGTPHKMLYIVSNIQNVTA